MRPTQPIPLGGVACGACGRPGYRHDPRTGQTSHVDGRVPPCRTQPPTVPKGA
jgi:hypothetical protein